MSLARRQQRHEGGEVVDRDDRHEGGPIARESGHPAGEQVEDGGAEPEGLRRLAGTGVTDHRGGVHDAPRHPQRGCVGLHDGVALDLGRLVGAEPPVLAGHPGRRPRHGAGILAPDAVPGQVHQPHEAGKRRRQRHHASCGVDIRGACLLGGHAEGVGAGHVVDLGHVVHLRRGPAEVVPGEVCPEQAGHTGDVVGLGARTSGQLPRCRCAPPRWSPRPAPAAP